MDQFIKTLDEYFGKKAPQLPVKAKEIIVKVSPYLAILGIVFMVMSIVPLMMLVFGLGAVSVLAGYVPMQNAYISIAVMLATGIICAMAIPGLFKRTKYAWNLMFYSQLVSAVGSLLSLNIISLIIGLAIGFYILFQVKSYYVN